MNKLKSLLLSESMDIACGLLRPLNKAGFDIDIITTDIRLAKTNLINSCEIVFDRKLIVHRALIRNLDYYDFVIICDDRLLFDIVNSDNLSVEEKLKLLPVNSQKDFRHIGSKIGLMEVLSLTNINIPDSVAVNNLSDAIKAAKKIGYPILVKIDFSGGGTGVFECKQDSDFNLIDPKIFDKPVLLQKKIKGIELDLSALYLSGKLINFNYSEFKKVINNQFGPSSLRLYHQLATIDRNLFTEMQKLGEALGADGFTNISAIKSFDDNKVYFFEVDMRPNVWVDYGKFIGNDLAPRIDSWFLNGQILNYQSELNHNYPSTILMPYYLRISSLDLLFNRYNSKKLLAKEEKIIRRLAYEQLFYRKIKMFLRRIKQTLIAIFTKLQIC